MNWASESIFYHIYPLGLLGAPLNNDGTSMPTPRLDALIPWIDHFKMMGVNALYIGPLFQSMTHGYDTVDYYHVDRRLGDDETLRGLVNVFHANGIRIVLDAVLHHVGREFWAFRDVLERREQSAYRDWFANLRFDQRSPYGDPFSYEAWNGHYNLVKLNLRNPEVKQHLLGAVRFWMEDFGIDGLRLDAADCMDIGFLQELRGFCRSLRDDFWLMGEAVHGDYRRLANESTLDSVTNYELYKGLYSSHVDKNYFEIAYSLQRQFGPQGMYRGLPLYTFADNHDVNRVASMVGELSQLFPLYCLLLTVPGVPSIYYGSEWGLRAERTRTSDAPLRPVIRLEEMRRSAPMPDLTKAIAQLVSLRRSSPALQSGDYEQVEVRSEQLAFVRRTDGEYILVMVNASSAPASMQTHVPGVTDGRMVDLLNGREEFRVERGKIRVEKLWPNWARVLQLI
jgi:cyclomaltodextrinase / maltogenic alpha-amylase / neopullulanase